MDVHTNLKLFTSSLKFILQFSSCFLLYMLSLIRAIAATRSLATPHLTPGWNAVHCRITMAVCHQYMGQSFLPRKQQASQA